MEYCLFNFGSFYNPVWYYDILSFTFWFITAGLVVQMNSENTTTKNL